MFTTQTQESVEIWAKTGVHRGLDKVKNEANLAENEGNDGAETGALFTLSKDGANQGGKRRSGVRA
jgi:hypothetical protein